MCKIVLSPVFTNCKGEKMKKSFCAVLVLIAASVFCGCREPLTVTEVVTDTGAFSAGVENAFQTAAVKEENSRYWDVFLPYIQLSQYSDSVPGIWMTLIIDENGEKIWSYNSEDPKYAVNVKKMLPAVKTEFAALQPSMQDGAVVWGAPFKYGDKFAVFGYAPVPESALVEREGASVPQYLVAMVVNPALVR